MLRQFNYLSRFFGARFFTACSPPALGSLMIVYERFAVATPTASHRILRWRCQRDQFLKAFAVAAAQERS